MPSILVRKVGLTNAVGFPFCPFLDSRTLKEDSASLVGFEDERVGNIGVGGGGGGMADSVIAGWASVVRHRMKCFVAVVYDGVTDWATALLQPTTFRPIDMALFLSHLISIVNIN